MAENVVGIPYEDFRGPIQDALLAHADRTGGRITFDTDEAGRLEAAPDGKGYSARSTAGFFLKDEDERAGSLTTIVFAPGDGSGDQSTYNLSEIDPDHYPHKPGVIPRSKEGVTAEAALTIVSFAIDVPPQPVLLAASLEELTLERGAIAWLGQVGQDPRTYERIMAGKEQANPTVTLTVGSSIRSHRLFPEFRNGDPHAIYNGNPTNIQVVSFIGLKDRSTKSHKIIRALNPELPRTR